nr:MAG TPA: hypothetical protein [Caudoviricetes sp.]
MHENFTHGNAFLSSFLISIAGVCLFVVILADG